MNENPCPIATPKLLKVPSIVETCARCGVWVHRYPAFLGEFMGFWRCDKCGNTSIKRRPGRPYGPRSKAWESILSEWEDCWTSIPPWDRSEYVVVCDPPLTSIDWQAIEDWYASRQIYRIFIGFGGGIHDNG